MLITIGTDNLARRLCYVKFECANCGKIKQPEQLKFVNFIIAISIVNDLVISYYTYCYACANFNGVGFRQRQARLRIKNMIVTCLPFLFVLSSLAQIAQIILLLFCRGIGLNCVIFYLFIYQSELPRSLLHCSFCDSVCVINSNELVA